MKSLTPAAVVERGTTSAQRVIRSTLAELPAAVERARIEPPALFIVGTVVRHADTLDWFGKRPLSGERLVIASPGGDLGTELDRCGAEVVEVPLPVTPAVRVVLCVLRSPEEADALDEERDGPGWDSSKVVAWCLSPAAAGRARLLGWRNVVHIPDEEPGAVIRAMVRGNKRNESHR
jgi:hypothetical protein